MLPLPARTRAVFMPASAAAQVGSGAGVLTFARVGEKRDRRRRRIGKTIGVRTEYLSASGRTERPFGFDIRRRASDEPTVGHGSIRVICGGRRSAESGLSTEASISLKIADHGRTSKRGI